MRVNGLLNVSVLSLLWHLRSTLLYDPIAKDLLQLLHGERLTVWKPNAFALHLETNLYNYIAALSL